MAKTNVEKLERAGVFDCTDAEPDQIELINDELSDVEVALLIAMKGRFLTVGGEKPLIIKVGFF